MRSPAYRAAIEAYNAIRLRFGPIKLVESEDSDMGYTGQLRGGPGAGHHPRHVVQDNNLTDVGARDVEELSAHDDSKPRVDY